MPGANNPSPPYPWEARTRGQQGVTRLRLRVTPDGRVLEARILESSGHESLDAAAIAAVRRWRFEPALRDGVPVFANATVTITFTLEGARQW
jgi:protein TonB